MHTEATPRPFLLQRQDCLATFNEEIIKHLFAAAKISSPLRSLARAEAQLSRPWATLDPAVIIQGLLQSNFASASAVMIVTPTH
jgi:hypothetical protein